jgi:hypothetical protein
MHHHSATGPPGAGGGIWFGMPFWVKSEVDPVAVRSGEGRIGVAPQPGFLGPVGGTGSRLFHVASKGVSPLETRGLLRLGRAFG